MHMVLAAAMVVAGYLAYQHLNAQATPIPPPPAAPPPILVVTPIQDIPTAAARLDQREALRGLVSVAPVNGIY